LNTGYIVVGHQTYHQYDQHEFPGKPNSNQSFYLRWIEYIPIKNLRKPDRGQPQRQVSYSGYYQNYNWSPTNPSKSPRQSSKDSLTLVCRTWDSEWNDYRRRVQKAACPDRCGEDVKPNI
jgi:hypothetical protein